jgi:predicted nucleotidyltransferase
MSKDIKEFLVRLPLNIYEMAKVDADSRNISLNAFSKQAISAGLSFPESFIQIQSLLRSLYPEQVVSILIFGSTARGDAFESSDVDVLLVLDSKIPIDRDLYTRIDKIKLNGKEVSVSIVHLPIDVKNVGSLWLEVALDGIVLYDPDLKVSQFLTLVRQYILSGSVERKSSYGVPYWTHIN